MIDCKKLMIGDFVYYLGDPQRIASIDSVSGTVRLSGVDMYTNHDIICEAIEPVPLSFVIFEANGFRNDCPPYGDGKFPVWRLTGQAADGAVMYEISIFCDKAFTVKILNHTDGGPLIMLRQIESVHELQHAIRLMEIDMDITVPER